MIDPERFDEICSEIATGMPAYKAMQAAGSNYKEFYGSIAADPALREKYARAKEAGLDIVAEDILRIADECRIGTKTKQTQYGPMDETVDMVDRSRLQIDARKWLLAKLAPKKYGESSSLELSGTITHNSIEERLASGRARLADPDAS